MREGAKHARAKLRENMRIGKKNTSRMTFFLQHWAKKSLNRLKNKLKALFKAAFLLTKGKETVSFRPPPGNDA